MTDLLATPSVEPSPTVAVAADNGRPRRKLPLGLWFGIGWLAVATFHAYFASRLPWVRGENQRVEGAGRYRMAPSADFWFGSDKLGKDVFARCVYGAKLSITLATVSIVVGLLIGGSMGMIAGYFKGSVDRVLSIVIDALLAFPALIVAALLIGRFDVLQASDIQVAGFGFEWLTRRWSIAIVFSLLSIAPVARIVRAQTLSLSEREFVLASRSLGARTPRILFREVLPNLVPAMVSVLFTGIGILLAAEGALAFLGYSIKAPDASWGLMINEARVDIDKYWWATIMPAVMLFMTVLAFNLIGNWVAKHFDIREAAI